MCEARNIPGEATRGNCTLDLKKPWLGVLRPQQQLPEEAPDLYTKSTTPYTGLAELSYPMHDRAVTVTQCGRVCYNRQKINLSRAFAGQTVGVKQVADKVWLVSFMQFDLGYFDLETCRLEPIENPFAAKVLPMCPEWTENKWRARQDSNLRPTVS